jgi:hypothetical protein
MAIELAEKFPCNTLKPLGDIPDIKLLGGVELKAFVDIAAGPPTDCKLTFNLLIQLAPLLASVACLFKILNVIMKLKDFAEAAKNPPDIPDAVPGLLDAIKELEGCIPPLQLPMLAIMLKGILQLVINFLSCFLTQLNSLFEFRASLDFNGAEGNTVLTESLTCAKNGADAAQVNLLKALEPLVPIMSIAGSIGGTAGFPVDIPDFGAMSKSADVQQSIQSVNDAIATLQKVVDAIPG